MPGKDNNIQRGSMFKRFFAVFLCVPALGVFPNVAQQAEEKSVWDGIYSQAQAERGQVVYSGVCAKCHGRTGNGAGEPDQPESPSVARQAFLAKWDGRTVGDLFEYVRTTMPVDNPGSRTDQEYIDAIAYMFTLSKIPAGQDEMPPDAQALVDVFITPQPPQ